VSPAFGQGVQKKTTKYANEDLKFEVVFPGKPVEKDVAGGKQVLLEALGGKAVYFFQYTKFDNEVDVLQDPAVAKKILDGGREGGLKNLPGSKVIVEKEYKHNMKYPARDLEIDAPGLGIYRTYHILTPTHFYQVVVGGPSDFTDAATAKRFLDSFKLKE
jgi:hypothetical protein